MRPLPRLFLLLAGLAACSAPAGGERSSPPPGEGGETEVELRLEAAADRTGTWIEIGAVALVGPEGEQALVVTGGRFALDHPQGFRARGRVPAGRYQGLRLQLAGAWRGDPAQGGTRLLLGQETARLAFPLVLAGGGREDLLLALAPRSPEEEEITFQPRWEIGLAAPLLPYDMILAAGPDADGVLVVDRRRLRVHRRLLAGDAVTGLARGSSRNELLAVRGHREEVVALDLSGGTIRDRRRLPGGGRPVWASRLPAGDGVAVALAARRRVAVVSVPGLLARSEVSTLQPPGRMAVSRQQDRIYVLVPEADELLVLSGDGAEVLASVQLESWPVDLSLDEDQAHLAVVCRDAGRLLILDPASLQIRQSIFLGQGLSAVQFDDRGDRVFVAGARPPRLQAVDLATGQPVSWIAVPAPVTDLELDPEGRVLWAACPGARSLLAVDRFHLRLRTTVQLGGAPDRLLVPGLLEP